MREVLFQPLAEVLAVVFYLVIAGTLTVVGALAESAGLQNLFAGQTTIGLWEAVVGAVLIYAGISVAYHIVLPRLRESETAA